MKKRIIIAVCCTVLVFVGVATLILNEVGTTSTHHSIIRIHPIGGGVQNDTAEEWERALVVMNSWAEEQQFEYSPGGGRQSTFSSAENYEPRDAYYHEANPEHGQAPIEFMVFCDLNAHPFTLTVSSAEGYRKEHSERHVHYHNTLIEQMQAEFGAEKISGSIW